MGRLQAKEAVEMMAAVGEPCRLVLESIVNVKMYNMAMMVMRVFDGLLYDRLLDTKT